MIRGVFDILHEAPHDIPEAVAHGIEYAVAVGDGIYRLPGSVTRVADYPVDEPDLDRTRAAKLEALLASERSLPIYTTLWGGDFGFGLPHWASRLRGLWLGTECYPWPPSTLPAPLYVLALVKGWATAIIKALVAAVAFRGHTWFLVTQSYRPLDPRSREIYLEPVPAWSIRFFERVARLLGARGIFVLGWWECKAPILEAWHGDR